MFGSKRFQAGRLDVRSWVAALALTTASFQGGCTRNSAIIDEPAIGNDAGVDSTPESDGLPRDDAMASPGDGPVVEDAIEVRSVRLCDGTSDLRLQMSNGGSGQSLPGSAMIAERGDQFLLVDGKCHAWVLDRSNAATGELVLTAEQERTLTEGLQLNSWSAVSAPAGGGCADGPHASFRFDQRGLSGPTCGITAGTPWAELIDAFRAAITTLRTLATPLSGDVRYLVTLQTSDSGVDSRQPVSWPLAVPIDDVAVEEHSPYMMGTSLRATGGDAAALRAIRTIGGDTAPSFDYTPILAPTGLRYQLYIRDALPFEN